MMRNEVGGRVLAPRIPQKEPKIWRFPPRVWVNSREYSRQIQTATYPPFMKGTLLLDLSRKLSRENQLSRELSRGLSHFVCYCSMFPLFALAHKLFTMALAAAHAWCEHHQKLLGVRRLGGPEGFTMGDTQVRRPVASLFEKGVDFGLIIHRSPFMVDDKNPLVLSNYIFELLEVNPRLAGFLIRLHPEDVEAVVESVTAHAEKGAGTKTTLYVGQEEEEDVEEEGEEVEEVGGWREKDKPHHFPMIRVSCSISYSCPLSP